MNQVLCEINYHYQRFCARESLPRTHQPHSHIRTQTPPSVWRSSRNPSPISFFTWAWNIPHLHLSFCTPLTSISKHIQKVDHKNGVVLYLLSNRCLDWKRMLRISLMDVSLAYLQFFVFSKTHLFSIHFESMWLQIVWQNWMVFAHHHLTLYCFLFAMQDDKKWPGCLFHSKSDGDSCCRASTRTLSIKRL